MPSARAAAHWLPLCALQCALDHALLQNFDGLFQEDAAIQQMLHHVRQIDLSSVFPPMGRLRIPLSIALPHAAFTCSYVL